MSKRLQDTLLTDYASTRLTSDEKVQLLDIATQCGKKPGVVLREAFRLYLALSILIDTQKKEGEDVITT